VFENLAGEGLDLGKADSLEPGRLRSDGEAANAGE
jgi:hypothetical protein